MQAYSAIYHARRDETTAEFVGQHCLASSMCPLSVLSYVFNVAPRADTPVWYTIYPVGRNVNASALHSLKDTKRAAGLQDEEYRLLQS